MARCGTVHSGAPYLLEELGEQLLQLEAGHGVDVDGREVLQLGVLAAGLPAADEGGAGIRQAAVIAVRGGHCDRGGWGGVTVTGGATVTGRSRQAAVIAVRGGSL